MTSEFVALVLAGSSGSRLYPLTVDASITADHRDPESDDEKEEEKGNEIEKGNETDVQDDVKELQFMPKHLLPVAGSPVIVHLLRRLHALHFATVILAVSANDQDSMTLRVLTDAAAGFQATLLPATTANADLALTRLDYHGMAIQLVRLPAECTGTADALRLLRADSSLLAPVHAHTVVLPGDLIIAPAMDAPEEDPIRILIDAHRQAAFPRHVPGSLRACSASPPPTAALTMLLANVGDEDESGMPLKESAKAKKGGLAREDQDIEYIGLDQIPHLHHIHGTLKASLSYFSPILSFPALKAPQRITLKQSKVSTEEDEHNTGLTPKLIIPKARFHGHSSLKSSLSIRNDWSDIHAYALSPWTLKLLHARPAIKNIQQDLLPLLIARQFKGIKATFLGLEKCHKGDDPIATDANGDHKIAILEHLMTQDPMLAGMTTTNSTITNSTATASNHSSSQLNVSILASGTPSSLTHLSHDTPYLVNAACLSRSTSKLTLRACTIPSYLYACREMALRCSITPESVLKKSIPSSSSSFPFSVPWFMVPSGTKLDAKTYSILLPDSCLEEKVQIKSCTVGHRSKIGAKCRLNNVVIMDDVVIGDNCVLQNSVISNRCVIGEHSNLNDCQVGPGTVIPAGTKGKGESFTGS